MARGVAPRLDLDQFSRRELLLGVFDAGNLVIVVISEYHFRVAYVVVTFAYLGLADDSYTLPWAKLRYDTGLEGCRTDITESELHGAPSFTRAEGREELGRDQEEELHAYYRIPPYWRAL